MQVSIGQFIQDGIMIFGSLVAAIVMVQFVWFLANYAFFGGDDAHRAHSKAALVNATISIWLIMIMWLVVSSIRGVSYAVEQWLLSAAVLAAIFIVIFIGLSKATSGGAAPPADHA